MSSIEDKDMLMKNKLSKMSLLGNWHTEDIDSERLKFSVFSTSSWSKNMHIHNHLIVFISRWKEVANHTFKEYEQSCKEQFYLSELLQITWCIFAKQKYGKATDLSIVTYENIFDYSYNFESILIEKGLERKIRLCFNKLSKYRKLPVVYLNIYQRDIGVSKWYLEGYFHFHWLEIQQVGEVLEKIKNEIGKT